MGRPRKSTGAELVSIDDCTRKMAEMLVAITDIEVLTAERDVAVAVVSAQWEKILDDARGRAIEAETALKNYYYAHAKEIEAGGAKHLQLENGVMGRRFNPPSLKPLNRGWTWNAIAVRVRELWGDLHFHAPMAPQIDKESLKDLSAEDLAKAGLKKHSKEVFYAEPARQPASEN